MWKTTLAACVLMLSLTTAALAKTQVLKLKNGGEVKGEVTKVGEEYRVRTEFGTVTYPASDVLSVEDVVTVEDEYAERLAKIDTNNFQDHIDLAAWAMGGTVNRLDLAEKHLLAALELKADSEQAKILLDQVRAMQKPTTDGGPTEADGNGGGAIIRPPTDKLPLLSDEDINRIRVAELRQGEKSVRVDLKDGLVDDFISRMAGREEFQRKGAVDAFRKLPDLNKALYMLEKFPEDKDVTSRIVVKSDPAFMKDFSRNVYPLVRNFCGSVQCHGGPEPRGGWKIYDIGKGNEKTAYTNFYILDGVHAGSSRLVDRNNPAESLLLHYMLPSQIARYKHPGDIKPALKDREDRSYVQMLDWIKGLKGPLHPNYGVTWKAPAGFKLSHGGRRFPDIDEDEDEKAPREQDGAPEGGASGGDTPF